VSPFRDTHGKTLEDYPRPSVAVDTAVLTVRDELEVLMVRSSASGDGDTWRLPGTFLHPGERLADAVRRSLCDKAGVDGITPAQLRVFDDPHRDERGWVLSVGHVAVATATALSPDRQLTRFVPAVGIGRLDYQHDEIVRAAVDWLRARYAASPDPDALLLEPFRLRELHRLHEIIAGQPLQRDTFRRAMLPGLVETGEVERGSVGKPARLYRRVSG
jgi:ADP-ribose pyrophosphatase YjhB (NUDIX family)